MRRYPTAYCVSVNSASTSRWLAVVAALAVGSAGLLPAPHAHVDRADVLVHMHAIDDAVSHDNDDADHDRLTFDHGNHRTARTVIQSYDSVDAFVLSVTAVPGGISHDGPAPAGIRQANRTALLPTHDPL